MRSLFLLLLIVCTALAQVPNQRVNTLTATTGITNNGVYKHPTGAGLGLVFTSDAAGNATWQPDTSGSLWTNNTSESSSVVYLKAFPTNFQIRPYWTNGAMLTLGPYSTNWFDTAFGDPRQYYSIISARDVSRGDVDRNNFWFSTGLDTVGNVYGSIDGSVRTNFAILTIDAVGMPGGGTRRVQAGYDSTTTILNVVGETGSTLINDGRMTISTSITNLGTYQHTNGAFTGAVFLSTNNSGDAMWSTNIPNLVISNTTLFSTLISNAFINQAFITNLFTTGGSVGASLWTNDGIVLRPKPTNGEVPNFALRGGLWSNTVYGFETTWNNQTNVGKWSFAWGSNVMARGPGSVVFGTANYIETNSPYTTISGGTNIQVLSNVVAGFVGGGRGHIINFAAQDAVISGGRSHNIYPFTTAATIAGGYDNQARTNYATVGGGQGNRANGVSSVISGGYSCDVNGDYAIVAGGENNHCNGKYGVVSGGFQNTIAGVATTDNFGVIAGGDRCKIGTGTISPAAWSFIGGGRVSLINEQSEFAVLVGGDQNTIFGQSTNSIILGGAFSSVENGNVHGVILGGLRNVITSQKGDYSFILGHSNQVQTNFSGAIGVELTNVVHKSIDIGFNDSFKTTFYTQGTLFRTNVTNNASVTFNSHMIGTGSTTSLTADNQSVTVTNRNYIRLSSDSAVAGDRTFVLSSGVQDGQLLDLEWTGTNAGEIVDDFAATGGGNGRLSATWTPTQYDVLSLRWNGTDWIERSRSTN